ncbi:MAG: hypothetical protein L3J53_09020 [Proteobacteria bacterium]|nr:hypothetical protein [Pseudomonadota bacterium]
MKNTHLILFIVSLGFISVAFTKGDSINIKSYDLKGGGSETIIVGSPDVVTQTKYGTVHSNQSQIISFKNGKQIISYSGDVIFYLKSYSLILSSSEMIDNGYGYYTFGDSVYIETYEKRGGSTFSCSANNTVIQDGGQSSTTYRNVITVDCSTGSLDIKPRLMIP